MCTEEDTDQVTMESITLSSWKKKKRLASIPEQENYPG